MFLHSTAAEAPPPSIPDLTPAERAELERIARCNPPRARKQRKSLKETEHSDTEEFLNDEDGTIIRLPHIDNSTHFIAFDGTHVLVQGDDGKLVWVPYMYLRYACRSLSKKADFEARLIELLKLPANPDHSALPRIAVNDVRLVKFMGYYPRGDLVLYHIGSVKGLARLKDLTQTRDLKEFIRKQKELIEDLKRDTKLNKAQIIRKLGLGLKHDDFTPQLDADEEYDFIFAKPAAGKKRLRVHFESTVVGPEPKRTSCAEAARTASETEAAAILLEMMGGRP